jgi:hypothetical protein
MKRCTGLTLEIVRKIGNNLARVAQPQSGARTWLVVATKVSTSLEAISIIVYQRSRGGIERLVCFVIAILPYVVVLMLHSERQKVEIKRLKVDTDSGREDIGFNVRRVRGMLYNSKAQCVT